MRNILAKWGNSLALRIPAYLVKEANLQVGDSFELKLLESGEILIKPAHKKLLLDELVAGITPENCHLETDWGNKEGGETW